MIRARTERDKLQPFSFLALKSFFFSMHWSIIFLRAAKNTRKTIPWIYYEVRRRKICRRCWQCGNENYFSEHHMFDRAFESSMKELFLLQMLPAENGFTEKNERERATRERERERAGNSGSPGGVSRSLPRRPYCVSKQIERLALWHWRRSDSWSQRHRASFTPGSLCAADSRGGCAVFTLLLYTTTVPLVNWLPDDRGK